LVLVLVLVLYFWSCLKHCCARQALCDMIMLKCNKHLYFLCNKCRNSAKCKWSSYHFLTFFAQSYFFDNKHACCNRRAFCYVVLLLLNWSWSYNFGLGLDLIVLVLILVLTFWSCFHHWSKIFGEGRSLSRSPLFLLQSSFLPFPLVDSLSRGSGTSLAAHAHPLPNSLIQIIPPYKIHPDV